MGKYVVEINGQNFLIEMEGRVAKHGFFTFRCVEAPDAATAEHVAVQSVRETEPLRLAHNPPDDAPVINVTEITQLDSFERIEDREPGLVWYPEEDPSKPWWKFW